MRHPSEAPWHDLAALKVVLGRAARFRIDARPADRDQPVTTAAAWACGCQAEGSSYRELLLVACAAHTLAVDDDPTPIGTA